MENESTDVLPSSESLRLSQPSHRCVGADAFHASKLCEIGKAFLRSRVENFLRRHSHSPMSVSYQSDATPEITVERFATNVDGHRIVRNGKRTGEYLLERLFACSATGEHCVMFRDPCMLSDKTAWTHLTAVDKVIL
jgi:hypothetical protein